MYPRRLVTLLLLTLSQLAFAADAVPLLLRQRSHADGSAHAMSGFTQALIGYFEREAHLRFTPQLYPWRRAVALAEHGEGLLWGMPAEADEHGLLVFSKPVYATHVWLVVRRGDHAKIDSIQDLEGKVVSAFGGSRYSGEFEQLRGKLFQVQEDPDAIALRLQKLALHRVDVVLLHSRHDDVRKVQQGVAKLLVDADAEILPQPLQSERICFAAARGSDAATLLPLLDRAITRGRTSHKLDRIVTES